jgi:triosephosphate isomerase
MGGPIQEALRSMFGAAGDAVPLLYGGSVNPTNVAGFAAQACIHGVLVGGASLQAQQFIEIVDQTAAAKSSS